MEKKRGRENYLGIAGWAWAGGYRLERYLYILHRVTGLGLLLYGFLHMIVMTFLRLPGEGIYETTMRLFHYPLFKVGEYLVLAAFVYHAANGLRLILQELGFLLVRPTPPIYPYTDALQRRRPLIWAMGASIGALVVLTIVLFIVV